LEKENKKIKELLLEIDSVFHVFNPTNYEMLLLLADKISGYHKQFQNEYNQEQTKKVEEW